MYTTLHTAAFLCTHMYTDLYLGHKTSQIAEPGGRGTCPFNHILTKGQMGKP